MGETREPHIPPMPDGFTDRVAWDAIHWQFRTSFPMAALDGAVMEWQRANQERARAAIQAKEATHDQ